MLETEKNGNFVVDLYCWDCMATNGFSAGKVWGEDECDVLTEEEAQELREKHDRKCKKCMTPSDKKSK